jgi:ssDNA-binding Zn-finger/Zn-ribbon topoisomerase 1
VSGIRIVDLDMNSDLVKTHTMICPSCGKKLTLYINYKERAFTIPGHNDPKEVLRLIREGHNPNARIYITGTDAPLTMAALRHAFGEDR